MHLALSVSCLHTLLSNARPLSSFIFALMFRSVYTCSVKTFYTFINTHSTRAFNVLHNHSIDGLFVFIKKM